MLKYKELIDKLTEEQKIALLTDTKEGFDTLDSDIVIPETSINNLWDENLTGEREALFPSAKSLANSWDPLLAGEVARCLASMGKEKGDNLFVLPSPSAAFSVYGKELAEEPYLSSALVRGMAKRLKDSGAAFCLREPHCTYEDIRFLDKEPHMPMLFDRLARPFDEVVSEGGLTAVLMENNKADGAYAEANKCVFDAVVPKDVEQIVRIEDGDATTAALTSGKQLLGGSSLVISTALENYKRIYRSMEEGGATAQELNMTLRDGASISEEIIDNALDKKLDLASRCSADFNRASESEIANLARRAAQESIVLLKNNRALPLNGEKIALVGDIINDGEEGLFKGFKEKIAGAMSKGRCTLVGYEQGYRLGENVTPEMIAPACKLASKSSTTIAFVGMGATREAKMSSVARLTLPGNQVALLNKLRESAKRLIVVICGERLPDMGFDYLADAVLFAPNQGAFVAESLWEILIGKHDPCGRLAFGGYVGVDTSVREVQKRKQKGKQTIGPYIGYRYVDSNGEKTRYPVGFGLSYTSFEYSKLQVDRQGKATLTVRNNGKRDGYDVVQFYVGMGSSKRIRPRRELKGSVKVFLRAGAKATVSFKLKDIEIYDSARNEFVKEAGKYDVYVSSAFGHDKLSKSVSFGGENLEKENKRLSDYLQNVSNIVSEGYTMEAYCKPMNLKSKLKTFGAILFITTLFTDIIYGISCFMMDIDFADPTYLMLFLVINGICLGTAIALAIVGNAGIKRRKRKLAKQEMEATRELFKTVKPTDVRSIDALFEDEFDISLEAVEKKEITANDKDDSTYTFMAVDTDIPTLAKELESHFAEYGVVITPKMARKILSAVMTSRLLVVRSAIGISGERFVEIMARFFGTEPHCEKIKSWDRRSLLRYDYEDERGTGAPAPLMAAINSAINEGDKACFFGIDKVCAKSLGDMLMPYVQYFGNPDVEHTVLDEGGSVTLPSNLWFVVSPAKDQSIDDIPAFVSNLATLVDVEAHMTEASVAKVMRKPITCQQMDALIFRAKKSSDINENLWKGVDSLESFVNEKTPYHIGNKLFLQIEKYLAIYNTCEADLNDAMDCAVAGKLLPAILNILKDNEGMADVDLTQVVESFFGEEYATNCRNTIKRCVLNKVGTEVDEAPVAEVVETPAEVAETPAEVAEAPAEVADAPAEVSEEPADASEAPAEAAEVPAEPIAVQEETVENSEQAPEEELEPVEQVDVEDGDSFEDTVVTEVVKENEQGDEE